ncbi:MAG: hypothetical protein HDR01_10825 [Lachnospiraceae bacterium]|nr:hypothetical protein [Lachnospiraceae bacterium]
MNELLFNATLNVLKCIQEGKYIKLKNMQCLEKVSEKYINGVLKDYGGTLDAINEKEYMKDFQYIQIRNQNKYMTYLDMIIDGERSDLTLICEIEVIHNKVIKVIVDDIHVL